MHSTRWGGSTFSAPPPSGGRLGGGPELRCATTSIEHAYLHSPAGLETYLHSNPPPLGYALPITILSTSSRISSAYLIVHDPGTTALSHCRVGLTLRMGNGVSAYGAGEKPAHQRSWPAPAGDGEDASTQAGSLRLGEPPRGARAARPNAAWVMHGTRWGGSTFSAPPPAGGLGGGPCQVTSEPEARGD